MRWEKFKHSCPNKLATLQTLCLSYSTLSLMKKKLVPSKSCRKLIEHEILSVVPQEMFGSADCDTILYTIYLSLCTQSADPSPFRGTHCSSK